MAKFLSYEDRLMIESYLKENKTFTEIGKTLGRDRTTIAKEVKNYAIEQCTGYSSYPHNVCKHRKTCRRKKVCGTNDCKHPLVGLCKQCEPIRSILLLLWKRPGTKIRMSRGSRQKHPSYARSSEKITR